MVASAVLILFPLLMAYAAVSDLLTMTIANWVSAALVLGFLLVGVMLGLRPEVLLLDHLSCGVAVLLLTFAFFAFGWIGGGDAKLAAATAVWLGWEHLLDYGVEASAIGGALTLAILAWRKVRMPDPLARHPSIARLHSAASGIPYGVALAATGLLIYPDTAVWSAALLRA